MKGIRSLRRSNVKAQTVVYVTKTVSGKKVYIPVAEVLPGDRVYTIGVNFGLKKYESLSALKLSYYRWRTKQVSIASLDPEVVDYINKTLKGSDASLKNNNKREVCMSNKTNNKTLWLKKVNLETRNPSVSKILNEVADFVLNEVKDFNPLLQNPAEVDEFVRSVVRKTKHEYSEDFDYLEIFEDYSGYEIPYFVIRYDDSEAIVYFDAVAYNNESVKSFIQTSNLWQINEVKVTVEASGLYPEDIEIAEGDVVSSEKLLNAYNKLYEALYESLRKTTSINGNVSVVKDEEGYKILFEIGNPNDPWDYYTNYITITAC